MTMRQTDSSMARRPPLRALSLTALLALGACAGSPSADPNGEWSGTMVTDKGRCPDRAPSRLLVDSKDISFIPAGGVLVLHGRRTDNQTRLHAQLALRDMNHKPLPMVFEGALAADGTRIDGTYGTPSCRAHIVLAHPDSHPLQRVLGN